MRSKTVHLWWLVPVAILTVLAGAGWWFVDSLHYGNASPLHRAVIKNDIRRVVRLIDRGVDLDARLTGSLFPDMWGATPLHLAARRDHVEIVEQLIRAGADKEAPDANGFTPLHAALRDGADASAQALIRADAKLRSDPEQVHSRYAVENCGQPIQTALKHASVSTVQVMLDAGADLQSDIGDNAMGFVDGPDLLPKFQLLLEHGFSVDGSSSQGRPLHRAAVKNDAAAITFLLDHGADIEAQGGQYDFTPLLAAAEAGSNDAVTVLIERGANPKAGTDYFGSPVYAAAFSGERETVRLLLSMNLGIDLQAGRSSDGATPLHFAYWNNDAEMADLLIKAGALPNARANGGRLPAEFRK